MGGIGPGDLVVCVVRGPYNNALPGYPRPRKGGYYRVADIVTGFVCDGLVIDGYPSNHPTRAYDGSCFRKLDEDIGFDFREQLRAKPKEPVRAEQPLGTSAGGSAPPFSAPASQHSSTPGAV